MFKNKNLYKNNQFQRITLLDESKYNYQAISNLTFGDERGVAGTLWNSCGRLWHHSQRFTEERTGFETLHDSDICIFRKQKIRKTKIGLKVLHELYMICNFVHPHMIPMWSWEGRSGRWCGQAWYTQYIVRDCPASIARCSSLHSHQQKKRRTEITESVGGSRVVFLVIVTSFRESSQREGTTNQISSCFWGATCRAFRWRFGVRLTLIVRWIVWFHDEVMTRAPTALGELESCLKVRKTCRVVPILCGACWHARCAWHGNMMDDGRLFLRSPRCNFNLPQLFMVLDGRRGRYLAWTKIIAGRQALPVCQTTSHRCRPESDKSMWQRTQPEKLAGFARSGPRYGLTAPTGSRGDHYQRLHRGFSLPRPARSALFSWSASRDFCLEILFTFFV